MANMGSSATHRASEEPKSLAPLQQTTSTVPTDADPSLNGSPSHPMNAREIDPEHLRDTANQSTGFMPLLRAQTAGGHPVDTSQPAFPVYHRKIGNPTPLGLMGFATTTFVLSLYNCGARGVSHPQLIVALCVATGGLAQFTAGVWEFAVGNTFGAAAFCMYGSFWWSYAACYIPWFGITKAVPEDEMADAMGLYLSGWVVVTFIFVCACLRSSVALVSTIFFLLLTFIMLMTAEFTGNSHAQTAGGAIGIITALLAFYTAACGLCDGTTSIFRLPPGDLTRKD